MASHDSGVDTSNDSSCTNDNSNNTSFSCPEPPGHDNKILEGLHQAAQKLTTFQASTPEGTSTYKTPATHIHINKMGRVATNGKSGRYQHHHTTRNALIPYVCTLPNERKLRLAASVSNVELLVRLLDAKVDPDTADEHLRSPLHLAASRGKQ